jgi:hypothetical protein
VSARRRQALSRRRKRRSLEIAVDRLSDEWFPKQRRANETKARLVAWICGRRAGKTRSKCRGMIRKALRTRGGRFLYLNSTRSEAERLAWDGLKNDGMAAIVKELGEKHGLRYKLDASDLDIYLPDTDSRIFLRGADKEAELAKALGYAYHEVWWDEAQKIPPKLAPRIREVLMPALLDFGGTLCLTGTPVRQMAGLFYEVTRPEPHKRLPGWELHHWNLLDNTFFGATHEERMRRGMLELQQLFGGPDVAPLDGPIMQREGFGKWVREDSNYVYAVNKMPTSGPESIWYAPPRWRPDGFPDLLAALRDLPGDWRDYIFAMGVDLGFDPDPFAVVLWAWHPERPELYEVISYEQTRLRYERQFAILAEIREMVNVGIPVADAGGGGKPAVAGWSEDWILRYGIPFLEADKANKHSFIEAMNADILRGWVKYREDSPLWKTTSELQWATIVTGAGKLIEDPTMPNHASDAGLYGHRQSFNYRFRPPPAPPPEQGTPEWADQEAAALEAYRDAEEDYVDL